MDFSLTHKNHSPRDVFLYLLAVGTLYISAWRLIDLIFQYIDAVLPDKLQGTYYSYENIRISIATLLVVFPVYLVTTWYLRKDVVNNPEKRELRTRKWLLNLTLFVAAITIIVDLVTLTNFFLNGELTLRFFLKVLTVLVVAGSILAYYLWDLRREATSKPSKLLAAIVSLVILISIISGFFIVGSPSTQRQKRFDERRVMNLEFVQSQIIGYWQSNGKLPVSLEEMFVGAPSTVEYKDPDTGIPYEYRILPGKQHFELCATFSLSSEEGRKDYYGYSYVDPMSPDLAMHNWEHGQGKKCFDRTINEKTYQRFQGMKPYPVY